MIEVIVTSTDYAVNVTDSVSNITVTADNSLFTVTSVVSNMTVTSVTPVVTFDTEGFDFDFAIKNRGEWESGVDYTRNDVVRYQNSIYICNIQWNTLLNSATPPPDDTNNWELFYWNQWPKFYLTITNWLNVGTDITAGGALFVGNGANITGNTTVTNNVGVGQDLTVVRDTSIGRNLTVASTATIGGNASIGGNLSLTGDITADEGTYRNLTVNNQFAINGLNYPIGRGIYGQILSTDGSGQASWVNISDLNFWNLTTDLQTNGFNIVTGYDVGVPNPQLTIGSGETGNFRANIEFYTGGNRIDLYSPESFNIDVGDGGGTDMSFNSTRISLSSPTDIDFIADNLTVDADITGNTYLDPMRVGIGGILFKDGTVQTTAGSGSGFTATQIATRDRLGVIRVGDYLTINTLTGVLSVDVGLLPPNYTLPAASAETRGGIRVGNGLVISDGDVLNVSSSTTFGNVSLTQDMYTNGYLIKHSSGGTSYLDLQNTGVELRSNNNNKLILHNSYVTLDGQTEVELKAPIVTAGDDIYNSRLHVGRIYNYSGVGPPLFPNGVQFDDQTVQITAYDDGRFDNGEVEGGQPMFTNRSWQALITYLISIDFLDPNLVWSEPDLG